jgi:hypothetical protein
LGITAIIIGIVIGIRIAFPFIFKFFFSHFSFLSNSLNRYILPAIVDCTTWSTTLGDLPPSSTEILRKIAKAMMSIVSDVTSLITLNSNTPIQTENSSLLTVSECNHFLSDFLLQLNSSDDDIEKDVSQLNFHLNESVTSNLSAILSNAPRLWSGGNIEDCSDLILKLKRRIDIVEKRFKTYSDTQTMIEQIFRTRHLRALADEMATQSSPISLPSVEIENESNSKPETKKRPERSLSFHSRGKLSNKNPTISPTHLARIHRSPQLSRPGKFQSLTPRTRTPLNSLIQVQALPNTSDGQRPFTQLSPMSDASDTTVFSTTIVSSNSQSPLEQFRSLHLPSPQELSPTSPLICDKKMGRDTPESLKSLPLNLKELHTDGDEVYFNTSRFYAPLVPSMLQHIAENRLKQANVTIWSASPMDKPTLSDVRLSIGKSEQFRIPHLLSRSYLLVTSLQAKKRKISTDAGIKISLQTEWNCEGEMVCTLVHEEVLNCRTTETSTQISFQIKPHEVMELI